MKRNILLVFVFFMLGMATNLVAQTASTEMLPKFPGGDVELMQFVAQNLVYPEQAKKDKVEGRVIVEFTITANGNVEKAKILRGLSPECDDEVLRIVGLMPQWTPAHEDGKPIDTSFVLPVIFKLNQ